MDSAVKKNDIMKFSGESIELEKNTINEVTQTRKI